MVWFPEHFDRPKARTDFKSRTNSIRSHEADSCLGGQATMSPPPINPPRPLTKRRNKPRAGPTPTTEKCSTVTFCRYQAPNVPKENTQVAKPKERFWQRFDSMVNAPKIATNNDGRNKNLETLKKPKLCALISVSITVKL